MSLNRYEWQLRTITFHDHNTVKADFLKDMYVHMRWVLTEFEKNARQYYQHTEFVVIDETLTLFRMSLFWVAHRWGSKKALPFLKSVTHISCTDETWYSYTLPKEDSKIYKSCDTLLEFC